MFNSRNFGYAQLHCVGIKCINAKTISEILKFQTNTAVATADIFFCLTKPHHSHTRIMKVHTKHICLQYKQGDLRQR